jgi:hypothetical protein
VVVRDSLARRLDDRTLHAASNRPTEIPLRFASRAALLRQQLFTHRDLIMKWVGDPFSAQAAERGRIEMETFPDGRVERIPACAEVPPKGSE